MDTVLKSKRMDALVLRLVVGLALLGWPRVGSAQGTWSVIAGTGTAPGQVSNPKALSLDSIGNLYVAEQRQTDSLGLVVAADRVQKRDAQGNWSVIATEGTNTGQVIGPGALAVDSAGSLHLVDYGSGPRIQKRDAQENWSVIATQGTSLGQVSGVIALAADVEGNLYVADGGIFLKAGTSETYVPRRIQKRDARGNWSLLVGYQGEVDAVATDTVGNLYVAESGPSFNDNTRGQIEKRGVQGRWSVIEGSDRYLTFPSVAVDAAGNLYVVWFIRCGCDGIGLTGIMKWDAQGNWSEVADLVDYWGGRLAVDGASNLYVADTGNNRVLKYAPGP